MTEKYFENVLGISWCVSPGWFPSLAVVTPSSAEARRV